MPKRVCLFIWLMAILTANSFSQIRSGSAFLKILPGTRLQSMAASHTAVIDDMNALYANPGATGFLREWQWSVSYTKWLTDIYHASALAGMGIRTPWSRHTRIALGVLYQGIPEFDSTDKAVAPASASDMVVSFSLGQPLTVISPRISVGANIKYLRNTLDTYTAGGPAADIGIQARTLRFSLGNPVLPQGILSVGVAATHLGNDLTFDQVGTPLPRTLRYGMALYAGSHRGLQVLVAANYVQVKDEKDVFGCGAELSWGRRFSIHGGYDFGADLMDHFSMGASIRLDDVGGPSVGFPGRNQALQLDLATLDEGEFFSRTYRGSVSHFPIGPEAFRFVQPAAGDSAFDSSILLAWENSRDMDLYDDLYYLLFVSGNRERVAALVQEVKSGTRMIGLVETDSGLYVSSPLSMASYTYRPQSFGDHYWAVAAIDRDGHLRFAESKGSPISHFYIPSPNLLVESIDFNYDPWLNESEFQGDLIVTIANRGDRTAEDFYLILADSCQSADYYPSDSLEADKRFEVPDTLVIDKLAAGETRTFTVPWNTYWLGLHEITALIDPDGRWLESDESDNQLMQAFHTIPKGMIASPDTATAWKVAKITIDMPIITDVSFDSNSTVVRAEYLHKSVFDPPLTILAERLRENPFLKIAIQGFADTNSERPSVQLANARAEAIRDSLVVLGVRSDQVQIFAGQVLQRRPTPVNRFDRLWVFEERRFVQVTSDQSGQAVLFLPVRHTDYETIAQSVPISSRLVSGISLEQAKVCFFGSAIQDTLVIADTLYNRRGTVGWTPGSDSQLWLQSAVTLHAAVVDSLGRTFAQQPQTTILEKREVLRQHRIAFPLKFAQTDPVYRFYWARLFVQVQDMLADPTIRMRFSGHACAVGPEKINEQLSERRANRFHNNFLDYIEQNHASYLSSLKERLDAARGYGEYSPLRIERLSGETILIGDNNQALGRKLNRRIEIEFYSTEAF